MPFAKDQVEGDITIINNWSFADATARAVATDPNTGLAYQLSDIGKYAKQEDTGVWYSLVLTTPTWQVESPAGMTGDATVTSGGAVTLSAKFQNRAIGVLMPSMSIADNIVMIRVPFAMTLTKVRAGAKVAPTVSVIKPKVMYHATTPTSVATVFASETNAPSIATSAFTADSGAPTTTALAEGGWIGIGFSAIDTGAGAGITVELIGVVA